MSKGKAPEQIFIDDIDDEFEEDDFYDDDYDDDGYDDIGFENIDDYDF